MTKMIQRLRFPRNRGAIKEGLLLAVAGASSGLTYFAQAPPISLDPSHDLWLKVLRDLGVSGALLAVSWMKHQQVLESKDQLLAQAKAHGDKIAELTQQHAMEKAELNKLRLEEQAEFSKRLAELQTANKTELVQIYNETATERSRFVEAVLQPQAARVPQKGRR